MWAALLLAAFACTLIATRRARQRAIENAQTFLDQTFSGEPTVSVKATAESLPYERIVIGAEERGYRILSQTSKGQYGQTLVFTRKA